MYRYKCICTNVSDVYICAYKFILRYLYLYISTYTFIPIHFVQIHYTFIVTLVKTVTVFGQPPSQYFCNIVKISSI